MPGGNLAVLGHGQSCSAKDGWHSSSTEKLGPELPSADLLTCNPIVRFLKITNVGLFLSKIKRIFNSGIELKLRLMTRLLDLIRILPFPTVNSIHPEIKLMKLNSCIIYC